MKAKDKKMLKRSVKGAVSFNERLRDHTTLRVGGIPSVWFEPVSIDDLRDILRLLCKVRLEPYVIGNGSNILASDGKIGKAFIRLSAPAFKKAVFNGPSVICSSGLGLQALIKKCMDKGLSGLEELAGIPGTVGGAIMVNAGRADKSTIGDLIEWIRIMDYRKREVSLIKKGRLKFSYRNSGLNRCIILEAGLRLKEAAPGMIKKRYKKILFEKRTVQEYRWPSAGCVFKNPANSKFTSGRILESCGMKGMRVRGAQVSVKHANFIINRGGARFSDVISLIKLQQKAVKKIFGIWLDTEIDIIK